MSKRKICIITGSRAEWGLFYPLAKAIKKEKNAFDLKIIATGSHLSGNYGMTGREIEKDGFSINRTVRMLLPGDTEDVIVNSVSLGIKGTAKALRALRPDAVFLLGDRFEIFAAAVAAYFLKIPICHIHGGEVTEGSMDDSLRHAITKMSHLHFTSADVYRKRVIQMGEEPKRVFNVGALGLDNIKNTDLLDRKRFEKKINFRLHKKNVMITFNPCTAEKKEATIGQFKALLKVVRGLRDTGVIFTKPNPDMYSNAIIGLIDGYVSGNRDRAVAFISMGRELYLSALQLMDVVAGNSSSGIIEVPSFGIPTVNVGKRQEGRIKPLSVIDAEGSAASIEKAFKKAFSAGFIKKCKGVKNPYGSGDAAKKIISVIKGYDFSVCKKKFYNLKRTS